MRVYYYYCSLFLTFSFGDYLMQLLLGRLWSLWLTLVVLLILAVNFVTSVGVDEGLWLFNKPPRQLLKDRYGFDLSDEWLNRVQRSVVRFNSARPCPSVIPPPRRSGCSPAEPYPPGG